MNELLSRAQQPELCNFGAAPYWANSTNPMLSRAMVLYYLNRAYIKALADLSETEIATWEIAFQSIANTSTYVLPPPVLGGAPPNPPVHEIQRVYYAPKGMLYTLEFRSGQRLLSWDEFQDATSAGYLQPFSFGPQPMICAVSPDRSNLVFYPGSASSGDLITLHYSPVPTAGSAVPTLAQELDPLILPDECTDLLVHAAIAPVWERLREFGAKQAAENDYQTELARLKKVCLKRSRGDKLRITDADIDSAFNGPYPFWGPM